MVSSSARSYPEAFAVDGLTDLLRRFPRVSHVACADRAASNLKAMRCLDSTKDPGEMRLFLACGVHKAYSAHKALQEVDPGLVSGMLNVALSMRPAGTLSSMRRALALLFRARVRVLRNIAPPGPGSPQARYRAAVLGRCLGADEGIKGSQRKLALTSMLNGHWEQHRIEHYCSGDDCCVSEDDSMEKMTSIVVQSLLPFAAPDFPRSRWTRANRAVNWFALLSSCHQILPSLIGPWVRELSDPARPVVLADFELGDPHDMFAPPGAASGSVAEDDLNLGPRGFAGLAGVLRDAPAAPQADPDQAVVGPADGPLGETDWTERNRQARIGACAFVALPSLRGRLTVVRETMQAHVKLMSRLLHVSGQDWSEGRHAALLAPGPSGQSPQVRLGELACGHNTTRPFVQECERLLFCVDAWEHVPLRERTTLLSLTAFKQISAGAATLHAHLVHTQQCYPLRLFAGAFDAVGGARHIVLEDFRNNRRCLFDSFTRAYHEMAGDTPFDGDAMQFLRAHGMVAHVDIATIEASHATVRRVVLKSIQTHKRTLSQVAGDFFLLKHRIMQQGPVVGIDRGSRRQGRRRRERKTRPRPPPATRRAARRREKRRARGDGRQGASSTWKAFWTEQRKGLVGLPSKEERKEMSRLYRALSAEKKGALRARAARRSAQLRSTLVADSRDLLLAHQQHQRHAALEDIPVLAGRALVACSSDAVVAVPGTLQRQICAMAEASKREARTENCKQAAKKRRLAQDIDSLPVPPAAQPIVSRTPLPLAEHMRTLPTCEGEPSCVECRPASSDLAWRALETANTSVRDAFQKHWDTRHEVVAHLLEQPLEEPRATLSKCAVAGICVCSGEGRWISLFWKEVSGNLVDWCPPKSELRRRLKKGDTVLRLESSDGEQLWYHIGFVNMNSWVCSLLPLFPSEDRAHIQRAGASQPLAPRPGVTWLMMWQAIAQLNLTKAWCMTLWLLGASSSQLQTCLEPWALQVRRATPHESEIWHSPPAPPLPRRQRRRVPDESDDDVDGDLAGDGGLEAIADQPVDQAPGQADDLAVELEISSMSAAGSDDYFDLSSPSEVAMPKIKAPTFAWNSSSGVARGNASRVLILSRLVPT